MNLVNIRYDNLTFPEAVQTALNLLKNQGKSDIFFLNLDCLHKTRADKEYAKILNQTTLVLPDGVGVQMATRLFGGKMKANCNGTDFSPELMKKAAEVGYTVFLLGGKPGVAEAAAKNLKAAIPGLRIAGTCVGYFDHNETVLNKINQSGADILFVSMGVPLQEKWIRANREKLNPRLCLGVGGFMDFWSGKTCRAPQFLRAAKLEWFWRFLQEPGRFFKRYFVDDLGAMLFLFKVRLCGK